MSFFLQGLSLGLAYVAPIGLQNLFVINSALTERRRRAILTALIVIVFDIALALACFFGVGALMQRFSWLQTVILGLVSLLVTSIGIALLFTKASRLEPHGQTGSLGKTIVSACVVTWCNPQALIDSTMLLGSFQTALPVIGRIPFISGVAAASCLWFLALTLLISIFSEHIGSRLLRGINLVCGVIITFYGLQLLYSFLLRMAWI